MYRNIFQFSPIFKRFKKKWDKPFPPPNAARAILECKIEWPEQKNRIKLIEIMKSYLASFPVLP